MGVDRDYIGALCKAMQASGLKIPSGGNVLLSVADRDREECIGLAGKLLELGFRLSAAEDTYNYLAAAGIKAELVADREILEFIKSDRAALVINTPAKGKIAGRLGFLLRRTSMEYNVPCITSLDTANAMMQVLERKMRDEDMEIYALGDYSHNKSNRGDNS